MSAISIALYVDGRPQQVPQTLTGTHAAARAARGTAWLDLDRPAADDVRSVADELGVQPLVVEDSGRPHPRSKLERYGDVLLMVLLPARYVEADERVDFGEVQVLIGPDFVVTLRHTSGLDLAALRAAVETRPELLRVGPPAVLHAVVSHVVAAYAPVIAGLQNDIDEIEDEVFGGDPDVSRRIYALTREVIEFQRATAPLIGMLDTLRESFEEQGVAEELRRRLRHVRDDAHRGADRADAFRHSLGGHPRGQRHARESAPGRGDQASDGDLTRPERPGEAHLGVGGHRARARRDQLDLRDELRPDAGAAVGLGVPLRARAHARLGTRAVRPVQAEALAVAGGPARATTAAELRPVEGRGRRRRPGTREGRRGPPTRGAGRAAASGPGCRRRRDSRAR